jgi:hypothetical protein
VNGRKLWVSGWLVFLLALCGGPGAVLALPLGAWVAAAVIAVSRQSDRAWTRGCLLVAPVILAAVAIGTMFVSTPSSPRTTATWMDRGRTALELLAGAIGPGGWKTFPLSGWVVLGIAIAAVVALARVAWNRPAERLRALGLLAGIATGLALAVAVAIARAGVYPGVGFSSRYAVYSALMLAVVYLGGVRYLPVRTGRLGGFAGMGLALFIVGTSLEWGRGYGLYVKAGQEALRSRTAAGLAPEEIAAELTARVRGPDDSPASRQVVADDLRRLRQHRIGPYR